MRKRHLALSVAAAVAVTTTGVTVVALPASAAAGCRVAYSVARVSAWTLTWSYAAGQQVTQAWNATVTQSGSQVTARNAGYNGSIATNGTASFGFNGSWTGSNPVPASFNLNGTACTGSVSTTSPTPSRTPSSSPPPSGTGVPSDAVWVASGQWDTWTNGGFTVRNNIWGSGAGPQTIWARTGTNWGVVAQHPRTSGVKAYPHTSKILNRTLSSLGSLRSSFNVTVASDGDYATAYDIWANNYAYEVMIWCNQNGAVGPIAESYDANGAVPNARNVSVGGHTWNVYRGSNGSNAVFSFVRTSKTNAGTIDVLAVLNWLRTQNWWGDVNVGDVQFGFELTGTAGRANFTTNSYSLDYS
ncbi:cellulose binding domain-containing protein [Dactylosporangium sucinum]|uniref:CBM2 domain-containing protein n=1 Tax=Dactylosporangium sucinum TaxID=1424081 RepID=A0A917U9Z6_9ACTN|nr:cellulose binding domain-containing protein [Dactylosporangium sucinum]GGM65528.1 hypothetical protein GCM10007977_078890 [Dactylosporangium sucinum]